MAEEYIRIAAVALFRRRRHSWFAVVTTRRRLPAHYTLSRRAQTITGRIRAAIVTGLLVRQTG